MKGVLRNGRGPVLRLSEKQSPYLSPEYRCFTPPWPVAFSKASKPGLEGCWGRLVPPSPCSMRGHSPVGFPSSTSAEGWEHTPAPMEDCHSVKESLLLAFKSTASPLHLPGSGPWRSLAYELPGDPYLWDHKEAAIPGDLSVESVGEGGRFSFGGGGGGVHCWRGQRGGLARGWDVSGGQAGPAVSQGSDGPQHLFSLHRPHMQETPPDDSSAITDFILPSALKSSVAHCCLFTLDTS